LGAFKKFNTLIIETSIELTPVDELAIKKCVAAFKKLPSVKEKRRIRLWRDYEPWVYSYKTGGRESKNCGRRGYFTEVDLSTG